MSEWMTKVLRLRRVRALEEDLTRERDEVMRQREEIERLRAENRALLNSLLGTAGFPPIEFPAPPEPQSLPRLRRRSWHQVQAWREAEAARLRGGSLESEWPRESGGRVNPPPHPDAAGTSASATATDSPMRTNGPIPHS
ncbi:MAG TPA: hypothetical protein VEH49_04990 [Methylomirabilota bacterium]|nr:hypothetical protein [Methylomirabilota bacterium]